MTLFQWIAIPLLLLAAASDVLKMLRLPAQRRYRMLRAAIWASAAGAIYYPDLLSHTANAVGINRGADLVSYLFVLAFLVVSLIFYSQMNKLQRQITDLVRTLAIQQARKTPE